MDLQRSYFPYIRDLLIAEKNKERKMLVIILISVIGLVIYFSRSKNCRSPVTLHGKTVIVTGSNSGIGKATAKNMVERGAKVILACRDVEKGHEAASEITQEKSQVKVMKLDLSSFDSVRTFVKEVSFTSFVLIFKCALFLSARHYIIIIR